MDAHRCFSSRKRKQVRRACLNCQKAHSGCGEQRPCPRCVKRKEEHKCIDAPRRKRKDEPDSPPCITACEAAATHSFNNKRKRKLSTSNPTTPPTLSLAVKSERNAAYPRREIRSDDDDYEDLQDQDYDDGSSSYTAAALVKNTKRPRRQRWQPAFGSRNATLPFPFDAVKGEHSGSSGSEEEEEEEYACKQQHNHQNALGPMDLRQQHLLTQKFSPPVHLQQPSQRPLPMTTPNPTPASSAAMKKEPTSPEEGGSTFLFNLQEFDCVAPPGRQTAQLPVSATPNATMTTATPPGSDDEFSLDWLLPGAYPWPATTTTPCPSTATPAMAPFWGPDLPSSVVLTGEDTYGVSEEDAPFFYPDRTFEPLFSF